MSLIDDTRTATKLIAGFVLGALATLIVGVMGIHGLAQTDDALRRTELDGAALASLRGAMYEIAEIGKKTRDALLYDDPTAAASRTAALAAHRTTLAAHLRGVDDAVASADDQAALAHVDELRARLKQHNVEAAAAAAVGDQRAGAAALILNAPLELELDQAIAAFESRLTTRIEQREQTTVARFVALRLRAILVIVAATLVALLGGWWLARSLAVPLRRAVAVLDRVAAGDFTATLGLDRKDEVGQLAASLDRATGQMRDALQQVRAVSDGVAGAAEELAGASQDISSGAQQQASSLEESAASIEEMTATIKQSADNARQASQLALDSRATAEQGGEVVTAAVAAMAEINRSSKQIAEIITAIDEIAFQTNLLALNAAVEAARAGEQGRGFAVVAAEVRNLAQRSATAAKEIKGLIQDSVRKVEVGSELVNRSGTTLAAIVASVKRVTDIVTEMASAAREQSTGIDQINVAITQMDQVTQRNAASTEEMSATAAGLTEQADRLRGTVARFRLGGADGAELAADVEPADPGAAPRRSATVVAARAPTPGRAALARPRARRKPAAAFLEHP